MDKIKGLTQAEVIRSRSIHGENCLVKEKRTGLIGKLLENLNDPIIKVLLIAVFLQIAVTFPRCNWLESGGIIVAVMIATAVSTLSEYGSEKAFEKMAQENRNVKAKVIRGGEEIEIPANEVVVGDIMLLTAGDLVMADCMMRSGEISVDQSALNGESTEVFKRVSRSKKEGLLADNKVFRGSIVTVGAGYAEVFAVGDKTYYGGVARDVQIETRESPLKHRLSKLASVISKIGYIMAAIVGLTYLFFEIFVDNAFDKEAILSVFRSPTDIISLLVKSLTLMITVVVVAVPEGLPMMITVVLSANMKRMLKDGIMVKKLVGIETAGSMNILFTDKTGTVTTGISTVDRIVTPSSEYITPSALRQNGFVYGAFVSSAFSVSEARANSTDKALQRFFDGENAEMEEIISATPFSSEKKYSSVTLSNGKTLMKGAPEYLISICSHVREDADKRPINKSELLEKYKSYAYAGGRVIALAVSEGEEEFGFVGFAVLKDKIRSGVKKAVETIRSAGVQVVMITGDGRETAEAIARESGIISSADTGAVILDGETLRGMNDADLVRVIPKLRVVSRALPSDKVRLVRIAQALDLVVGMTGDGINDAPSLKLADIGFAMGSGTDIAKSAGDIVALDNSFSAITKTVLYGRTIFKSIRKFISFQLMMNLTACGISLIGQFIGIESPITIMQMLWINIIMDTLGGLAFAGEAPLDYYMMERPKKRNEAILSGEMLNQICWTGAYTLLICIAFLKMNFFKALFSPESGVFMTGFYALFVFAGLFNCLNTRSERLSLLSNIGKNKPFIVILSLIAVIQVFMIYFGGEVFRCVPLSPRELLNVILIASTVIPFDSLRRIIKKLS